MYLMMGNTEHTYNLRYNISLLLLEGVVRSLPYL